VVQVFQKLSVAPPEEFMVVAYLNEIAKTHNVDWQAEV